MSSHAATAACKPCLNKKYPLRKQLLLSSLSLAAVSLLLALGVVMGTTAYIGDKAESEARDSLEAQIERHLRDASVEAAATIGERFRKIQYGVLDVTAFALRDAFQEDLVLAGGEEGYPLSPAHTDLRDIEITESSEANLVGFSRQDVLVDLSRSVWYYADAESNTVEVSAAEDQLKINQSARLDLLWPAMYINSNDTKGILLGVELSTTNQMFRYFPGTDLSAVEGSAFACEDVQEDGTSPCYDPTERDWYELADAAVMDSETFLGGAIVTPPYTDAVGSENDWLVTLARAVYRNSGTTSGSLLGVVGVDMRLEQVQESVEGINFLETGYSILATADEGVVLAAGAAWDRDTAENITKVCDLGNGICSGDEGDSWEDLLLETKNGGIKTFKAVSTTGGGDEEESILIAAPITTTFGTAVSGGEGKVTHYILSAVPRDEIFQPVDGMADLIRESTTEIMVTTAIVACSTLVAVALSVYFLAGSITRPIVKMTSAARSISKDGAKTDVFGSVAATWGGRRDGSSGAGDSIDSRTAGRYTMNRTACLDYLLCRGDDEISTLAREFQLMITGLGRRGAAAEATGLAEASVYPKNPFTTDFIRPPPTNPTAPDATPGRPSAPGQAS
ncbi:unnamed protein product [Ectocarpus sp. CCAP 1310/34]|nr:unnamed protein product [Ectocarpus sp. CCAP 1310/34]